MNVNFINPFVEAAYEVLTSEMNSAVVRGTLRLDNGPYTTDDTTVVIALVGAVEGTVFYSMASLTAQQIASSILGEPIDSFNNLAQSGIAELGNVITGRASMKLSTAGYEANISPPSLIIGRGATISTLDYPRLVVPLETPFGPVLIHLALRQGVARQKTTAQMAVPEAPHLGRMP
jgi:chemotaxis protein CheX